MALLIFGVVLLGVVNAVFLTSQVWPRDGPLWGAARLLSVVVLGYAILRHDVLGIDAKMRWGMSKTAVAAVFVAAFFIAAQLAEIVFGEIFGPYVGVLAAGTLIFFLARIEAVADQIAGALIARSRGPEGARMPAAGQRFLGKYQVDRVLDEGAFGTIWLATHVSLDRDVVIKQVEASRRGDPSIHRRFLQEGRAMSAVDDPHVVTIYDVEELAGGGFLVMEHVAGGSLRDRLEEHGPLDPVAFHQVARDLLRALEAVHDEGLVHRDVKPSNVLLTEEGEARLADFGVASQAGPPVDQGAPDPRETQQAVYRTLSGTPVYMSPEQARGERLTLRSDLFSAAATLYEAWTGQPYLVPEPGEGPAELRARAAETGPFDRSIDAPPGLVGWFRRALAPDPGARYPDAAAALGELEDALREAVDPP